MATFNKPCIHCGAMIDGDSRVCPKCGVRGPLGILCPNCLNTIKRGDVACSSCGRALMTGCPFCKAQTFVGVWKCEACGKPLTIKCPDKRCGQPQFFESTKCTVCGKPIKDGKKQISKVK
ncbi:MAG: zinc ribbon domain-containing protein [Methanomassiliicoccaceae archaeon]|nr:zinc ribbon domain-containing protein [Methanomassiliicoccaceae archaeon]